MLLTKIVWYGEPAHVFRVKMHILKLHNYTFCCNSLKYSMILRVDALVKLH